MSCATQPKAYENALDFALASKNKKIRSVLKHVKDHEVQILYTSVNKGDHGQLVFSSYEFQVDSNHYFYPASSVKLIAAALSLEKLEQEGLSHETVYRLADELQQQTFSRDIQDIFAISSNDTYNRLFDYLGTDYIRQELSKKGIRPLRISHRLSTADAANPKTRDLKIKTLAGVWREQNGFRNQEPIPLVLSAIKKGQGFLEDGILVAKPFNFSLKNHFPIASQQALLKRIIFPETYQTEKQFKLGQEKRNFLLRAMGATPKELGYNSPEYYDSYGKFFMYGDQKKPIPSHIKIYNKVGYAYGTLTDNAYIVDEKNEISFLLTATILVNKNQIFNDNNYEYETIGIPFLAQLGREIYRYEKYQKRKKG